MYSYLEWMGLTSDHTRSCGEHGSVTSLVINLVRCQFVISFISSFIFAVRMTVREVVKLAPSALPVSKCENFDPFFH